MRRIVWVAGLIWVMMWGLVSCGGGRHSGVGVVSLPYSSDTVITFVALMDTLSSIQLEDTPDAYVAEASKIIEYNNKLFIFDMPNSKVLVFNEAGKYLYSIGRKGNGAGEYPMVYDFTINPDMGEVVIISHSSQVYIYAEDGTFKERKQISDTFFLHITYADSEYVCSSTHIAVERDNAYIIYTYNDKFEETGKYIPSLPIQVMDTQIFGSHLVSTGKSAYFLDVFVRKLYKIIGNKSEQLLEFQFPNPIPNDIDPMELAQNPMKYDWLYDFVPQDDKFIMCYVADGHMNMAVITDSGEVLASGLLAGAVLKMFPSDKGYTISPISKEVYYMDWLEYSYDNLPEEALDGNLLLFKWKCNPKALKAH